MTLNTNPNEEGMQISDDLGGGVRYSGGGEMSGHTHTSASLRAEEILVDAYSKPGCGLHGPGRR